MSVIHINQLSDSKKKQQQQQQATYSMTGMSRSHDIIDQNVLIKSNCRSESLNK